MFWQPCRASAGLIVAIVAGLAGAMDGPAGAQSSGRVCGASSDRPADIVKACTAIIRSGKAPASRIAIAYAQRGVALMDMNEIERAFADFTEAIRRDPKHAASYSNRGLLWRVAGDVDRAIADFSQAIRLEPNHPMAYNNRGIAWRDKGDVDRALADFNIALRLDPKYANAYFSRGVLWHHKKDYNSALADLDEAIRLDPKNEEFKSKRAEIAKDAGASSPVAQSCADFSGGWRRDIDGLVWGIHQSDCRLAGGEENFNYHHSLRGTVSQDVAQITIRRTTNATGCVATLTGTARVIDKSHIRVDLNGNGCGLPHNHSESFVYHRVY